MANPTTPAAFIVRCSTVYAVGTRVVFARHTKTGKVTNTDSIKKAHRLDRATAEMASERITDALEATFTKHPAHRVPYTVEILAA